MRFEFYEGKSHNEGELKLWKGREGTTIEGEGGMRDEQ